EAAEVLDLMHDQQGLQHLDVKPRNFFLVSRHVKVADFGLVTSLASCAGGVRIGAVTPLYAPPEVLQGRVSRNSDQYSLACCYMELLTGTLPFDGRNSRQMILLHLNGEPDLSPLPEVDRPIVARALSKDPEQRYPSCVEFIRALRGALPNVSEFDIGALATAGFIDQETPPLEWRPAPMLEARSDSMGTTASARQQGGTRNAETADRPGGARVPGGLHLPGEHGRQPPGRRLEGAGPGRPAAPGAFHLRLHRPR